MHWGESLLGYCFLFRNHMLPFLWFGFAVPQPSVIFVNPLQKPAMPQILCGMPDLVARKVGLMAQSKVLLV